MWGKHEKGESTIKKMLLHRRQFHWVRFWESICQRLRLFLWARIWLTVVLPSSVKSSTALEREGLGGKKTNEERVEHWLKSHLKDMCLKCCKFRNYLSEGWGCVENVTDAEINIYLTITCMCVCSWPAQEKAKEPDRVTIRAGSDAWGKHGGTVVKSPSVGSKAGCSPLL